jgi:hypothetical protein
MSKFRIELDGPAGQGVLTRDGEVLVDVTGLAIHLDPGQQLQAITTEHTLLYAGRAYVATEHHVITKATLLIEAEEA